MTIVKKISTFILLVLLSCHIGATTYGPKPRKEIVEKAEFIGSVKVVSGRVLETTEVEEPDWCGQIYTARVIEPLMGDLETVEFYSAQPMWLGQKYLVFLTRGDTAGLELRSTNSALLPALQKEAAQKAACERVFSGLKAIENVTSEFQSSREVHSNGKTEREYWVGYSHFAGIEEGQLKEITAISFWPETIRIENNNSSKVISNDDLVENMFGESPDYPIALLGEQLMKWDDVREAIKVEIEALKNSKAIQPTAEDGG